MRIANDDNSYLDPRVGTLWTADEDRLLLAGAEDHAGKLAYIARYISGQSSDQVRTRYRQFMRERANGPTSVITTEVPEIVPELPAGEFEFQEVAQEDIHFPSEFDPDMAWEYTWP
jgi:hypothetical protein